jgi:hypothetical protein
MALCEHPYPKVLVLWLEQPGSYDGVAGSVEILVAQIVIGVHGGRTVDRRLVVHRAVRIDPGER